MKPGENVRVVLHINVLGSSARRFEKVLLNHTAALIVDHLFYSGVIGPAWRHRYIFIYRRRKKKRYQAYTACLVVSPQTLHSFVLF